MTDKVLTDDELSALCEKATPGPWVAECRDCSGKLDSDYWTGLGWEVHGPPEATNRGQFGRGEDAQFIAAAREAMPRLIGEKRALRQAFLDFGDHMNDCDVLRERGICNCGFSHVIANKVA